MEENRDDGSKTIIQLIISGGQVNISTDNGEVNANQNNEPKIIEKQVIIDNESQNYTRNRNRKSGETDNGTVLLRISVNFCSWSICAISLADFIGVYRYIFADRIINMHDIL